MGQEDVRIWDCSFVTVNRYYQTDETCLFGDGGWELMSSFDPVEMALSEAVGGNELH